MTEDWEVAPPPVDELFWDITPDSLFLLCTGTHIWPALEIELKRLQDEHDYGVPLTKQQLTFRAVQEWAKGKDDDGRSY